MWAKSKQSGFTIVELLIVIVVIAILAAITLVSYDGIQNRARLSGLQSDLEGSGKALETYKYANTATTGGEYYPVNLSDANVKSGDSTTYQYIPNAAVNPTGYCLTGTNNGVSYSISSVDLSAQQGLCIVNYAPNPSAEGTVNLVVSSGAPTITLSNATFSGWPMSGTKSFKIAATTTANTRVRPVNNTIPVANGKPIMVSAYIYNASAGTRAFDITFQARTSGGSTSTVGPTSYFSIASGQTMLISSGLPTSVDLSSYAYIEPMFSRDTGSGSTASDVFYIDNIMLSYSDTTLSYSDGNAPSWQWMGATNDSTSVGPMQP